MLTITTCLTLVVAAAIGHPAADGAAERVVQRVLLAGVDDAPDALIVEEGMGAADRGPAAQPGSVDAGQPRRVLVMGLEAAGASADIVQVANGIVVQSLARASSISVITDDDIRRLVELEAEREVVGCSTASCLAEIAGALGADFVVFGTVGKLDELFVVQLNLFDAAAARAMGREEIRARRAGALASPLTTAAAKLVEPLLSGDDPLREQLRDDEGMHLSAGLATVAGGGALAAVGALFGGAAALAGLAAFGLMQTATMPAAVRNVSKTTGQVVTIAAWLGGTVAVLGAVGAGMGSILWLSEGE
jgi:hypothetical protein